MLRPLSLFLYQGIVTTADVVIDPMCADLDSEVQQMERKVCKESTKKKKPEQLLNKLCIHVSMLNFSLKLLQREKESLANIVPFCHNGLL